MSSSISGQVMASMSEVQVRQEVAGALAEAGCEDMTVVLARVDEHLERRLASIVPARGGDVVSATISELQKDIKELMADKKGEPCVKYVRNDAPSSGILHIARTDTVAICGWKYSESGFATVSNKSARGLMCKQCKAAV